MRADNNKKKKTTQKKKTAVAKKAAAVNKTVNNKVDTTRKRKAIMYTTHDGYRLTSKEAKFIDGYLAHGNQRQAVLDAGYQTKAPGQYAQILLRNTHIAGEIEYRMNQEREKRVASGQEVMEFFAAVMRGEVKDQFQLDAPLSERIKAGQEIAKRTVDIANKIAGVKAGEDGVTIKLDWSRKHG